jgi:hypothetical protein
MGFGVLFGLLDGVFGVFGLLFCAVFGWLEGDDGDFGCGL